MDENLMRDVLSLLNLKEKVICVSKVCKAWNELKGKVPGIFVDLSCSSGPRTAGQTSKFLNWIPKADAAALTGVRIATDKKDEAWAALVVMHNLAELKQPRLKELKSSTYDSDDDDEETQREKEAYRKIKATSLSDIQKFCIDGKMKYDEFLMLQRYGVGPCLTHFSVDGITFSTARSLADSLDLQELLHECTMLQVLEMPSSLVSSEGLFHTLFRFNVPSQTRADLRVLDLTKITSNVPAGIEVCYISTLSVFSLTITFTCIYLTMDYLFFHRQISFIGTTFRSLAVFAQIWRF